MFTVRINDGYGSYVCECGRLHDYSKIKFDEMEKDCDNKNFENVND